MPAQKKAHDPKPPSLVSEKNENASDKTETAEETAGKIKILQRREQLEYRRDHHDKSAHKDEIFHPSLFYVFYRFMLWTGQLVKMVLYNWLHRIISPDEYQLKTAEMMKSTLDSLGPAGIKIGQQLGMRSDLIDQVYCDALLSLLDQVKPMSAEDAIQTLENAYGKKIEKIFSIFDPKTIGSGSIACVYQAILHSGEKVAVKVRRPGIGEKIFGDTEAILKLIRISEILGIIPPDVWSSFIKEVSHMLREEINFKVEARYTEIFHREAKKNPYVSSPSVYFHLCRPEVVVTELVSGAFLSEFLAIVESNDIEKLDEFNERGFDFKLIAERLFHVFFWEVFESNFFHADPHPKNIIVKPDNTFIMIDFGSCGLISNRFRRHLRNFYQNLLDENVYGLCQSILSSLEPIPLIDTEACINDLVTVARNWFFAQKSDYSEWEEKCVGGAFTKLLGICGKHGITSQAEGVRFYRANFLYDSIIYRIDPSVDVNKIYIKWYREYAHKSKIRFMEEAEKRIMGPIDEDYATIEQLLKINLKVLNKIEEFIDLPRYNFLTGVGKFAFAASTFIKTTINTGIIFVSLSIFRYLLDPIWSMNVPKDSTPIIYAFILVLTSKFFQGLVAVILAIQFRKVILKLDTKERS